MPFWPYAGSGLEVFRQNIVVNGMSLDMMMTKFLADMPEIVIQQDTAYNPISCDLVVKYLFPTFE